MLYAVFKQEQWIMGRVSVRLQFLIKLLKAKDKERILKTAEVTPQVQGSLHKINCWLLTANHGGQKAVGWHLESVEREKKKSTKNSVSAKLSSKYQGNIKTLPAKQKQSLSLADLPYKNTNGTFPPGWNERKLDSNSKLREEIKNTSKVIIKANVKIL